MRKVSNLRIIALSSAELAAEPYASRKWKRREIVENTDTFERRRGDGLKTWIQLKPYGAQITFQVDAVATANVNIANGLEIGDTVNGVVLTAGMNVLLPAQTAPAQNGIYPVGTNPSRHTSFNTFDEHVDAIVLVKPTKTVYRCTSNAGGVLGTDPIKFTKVATELLPSTMGVPSNMQHAVPPDGSIVFFLDYSDGMVMKYCTMAEMYTAMSS